MASVIGVARLVVCDMVGCGVDYGSKHEAKSASVCYCAPTILVPLSLPEPGLCVVCLYLSDTLHSLRVPPSF